MKRRISEEEDKHLPSSLSTDWSKRGKEKASKIRPRAVSNLWLMYFINSPLDTTEFLPTVWGVQHNSSVVKMWSELRAA